MKRAICLGGGGPAAGLEIGALKCFEEYGIEFDVWSLSCVGVWVGGYYNSFDKGNAAAQTEDHFRKYIFRDDVSYDKFPISPGFVPDIQTNIAALTKFILDPKSYQNLYAPVAIQQATEQFARFMSDPKYWQPRAFNQLFAAMAAANPMARFLTSMNWLSERTGITCGHHPGASLTPGLDIDKLYEPDKPFIYHPAFPI